MFWTYLFRELSNRRKQTAIIATGMALAIALVIIVNSVAGGVKAAQATVLESVYGVGTDVTISQAETASSTGRPTFTFGSGGGTTNGNSTTLSQSRLTAARGKATFDASELTTVQKTDGVKAAAATLSLQLIDFSGSTSRTQTQSGTGTGTGTAPTSDMPTIVVSDSVFSMDGDIAPLAQLLTLCRRYDALLVLDEAHAVLGPDLPTGTARDGRGGRGMEGRDRVDVQRGMVVRVGTLSKTLGSLGGFVAASRAVVDLIVNRARSYIFSTAPTPAAAAAALAALRVLRSPEGAALTGRLAALIQRVEEAGFAPPGHPSPIIPVILGSEQAALTASAALLDDGLWVPAIRPPTVPVGTSRLRVTVSAAHSDDDVARLLHALDQLPQSATTPAPTPAAR